MSSRESANRRSFPRALPLGAALIGLCVSFPICAAPSLLKDINPVVSPSPSNHNLLANVNGTLYFLGEDEAHGREIWKSDGTSAGTVMVKDINPGAGDSDAHRFVDVNGTVFFVAETCSTNSIGARHRS